jgi:uncharacterized ParB-like nuclease family protein
MASVEEIEAMMQRMLGETLAKTLGLENGETLAQTVAQALNTAFEEKLKIGENGSVDLPKMERQVDDLYSVTSDAVLRTLRPTLVGKGTNAEGTTSFVVSCETEM